MKWERGVIALRNHIRNIINDWDPMCIAYLSPDEYDPEVTSIIHFLNTSNEINEEY